VNEYFTDYLTMLFQTHRLKSA